MSTDQVDIRNGRGGDLPRVTAPPAGGRAFAVVWCGQFVAVSSLTVLNFAAAFYVYGKYSLIILGILFALPFVPFLIASLFSGALVDRWGPRRALLVSNIGGVVLAVSVFASILTHSFSIWHGLVVITAVPILKALLLPSFETSVSFLVPKKHLGRANGTRMLVNGAGAVMGPIAAGLLLHAIGISMVGLLVTVLLGLAIVTLVVIRIPRAVREARPASVSMLWKEVTQAWQHMRTKRGMLPLMGFFGVVSFGIGFVEVLLPGLVESFAPETSLIAVLSVGVIGMAAFGVAMTIWGGPRNRVGGILGYTLLFGGAMVVGTLRPNIMLIAVAAFAFLGSTSIIIGNVHTILNQKIEPELIGRVMGIKNAVYAGLLMVGNLAAGGLSSVFEPLVGDKRLRFPGLAVLIGDGPGRGFALVMMAMGVLIVIMTAYAYRWRRLRQLEKVLPDVTPEDILAETAQR